MKAVNRMREKETQKNKTAEKQREQRLSSKGENNFNQESVTDNLQ